MELTKEQIEQLKKPLPKEAISPHPTKTYLSTIKVIYIVERLNEVFGLGGWSVMNEFVERVDRMVVVKAKFRAGEGIYVEAFGGNDNTDLGDAYKGACTDALSKIGSYLYIGMDVYKGLTDAPRSELPTTKNYGTSNYNPATKKGKPITAKQKTFIEMLAMDKGIEVEDLENFDSFQASQKIEELKNMKSKEDDDLTYEE